MSSTGRRTATHGSVCTGSTDTPRICLSDRPTRCTRLPHKAHIISGSHPSLGPIVEFRLLRGVELFLAVALDTFTCFPLAPTPKRPHFSGSCRPGPRASCSPWPTCAPGEPSSLWRLYLEMGIPSTNSLTKRSSLLSFWGVFHGLPVPKKPGLGGESLRFDEGGRVAPTTRVPFQINALCIVI